jgi:predicted secreted protein
MQRSVVSAASVQLVASLIVICLASPALAGDRAAFNAIGFSSDFRYFAFEEYGVQDGSGFPYSTIYAVDLPADKWVSGAPFTARLEEDGAEMGKARSEASKKAGATLDKLGLSVPADVIALNGDGETFDGKSLSFGRPGFGTDGPRDIRKLTLETFPAAAPADVPCADYTDSPTLGFSLKLDGAEIYKDAKLPASRGCALDYKIYGVVEPFQFGPDAPPSVAIVSVYPFGYEGPDRRFIAVPLEKK